MHRKSIQTLPEKIQTIWVMYDEIKGRDAGRFETWQAERMYSMEEQYFKINEKETQCSYTSC